MKKPFSQRALGKFLLGRGFYAALAVCVIGAGSAAWVIVDRTIDSLSAPFEEMPQGTLQNDRAENDPAADKAPSAAAHPVEQTVTDLPKQAAPSAPYEKAAAPVEPPKAEPAAPTAAPAPITSFLLPVNDVVFGQFSGDELVMDETLRKWHTHNGIDIKAAADTPVLAVANGTVSSVKTDPMWGCVIEVTHADGLLSRYCGLQPEPMVQEGQQVLIGDTLGLTASSILAETALESHLHFELYENGQRVDPLVRMGFLESED